MRWAYEPSSRSVRLMQAKSRGIVECARTVESPNEMRGATSGVLRASAPCVCGVDSVDIIGIEPTRLDCGQQWSPLAVAGSALHRVQHVVHRDGVLVLRAEQNDLGVFDRPHAVSGRPVEEVVLFADVDLAIGVSHHDFP